MSSPNPGDDLPPLFILYGSATGNAEHISKELRDQANSLPAEERFFSSVYCGELDSFKKKCLSTWQTIPAKYKYPIVVVSSTTGNGEAPENANRFIRFIKKKSDCFMTHCNYCVLGLGDTNYEKFCNVGKILDKQLQELGGTRVMKLACADEATGLEDTVEPWKQRVLAALRKATLGDAKDVISTEHIASLNVADKPRLEQCEDSNHNNSSVASRNSSTQQHSVVQKGISILHQLASEKSISIPLNTDTMDPATFPSIAPSRSSAEILKVTQDGMPQHQQDQMCNGTITSGSTAAFYTCYHPYESTILSARYLTQTSNATGIPAASQALYDNKEDSTHGKDSFDTPTSLRCLESAMESISSFFPLSIPNNDKRVIELTLSLPNPALDMNVVSDHTLDYQPGDAVGIITPNLPRHVLAVLSMLEKQHGILYTHLVKVDEGSTATTVMEAVQYLMDLQSIPKRRVLYGLAQHASDEKEKTALLLLSSKTLNGESLYEAFISRNAVSIGDIFSLFPSCTPTLETLLALLPSLPPRYYSVCCSPLEQMQEKKLFLRIAFAVVDFETPNLGRKFGMTTRYLETIASPLLTSPDSATPPIPRVKLFSRGYAQISGTEFHLPSNIKTPLILIGPGTGIAPFVGFIAHRRYQSLLAAAEQRNKPRSESLSISEGTWRGGYEVERGDVRDGEGLKASDEATSGKEWPPIDVFFWL